jgi:hypothetical protein
MCPGASSSLVDHWNARAKQLVVKRAAMIDNLTHAAAAFNDM